VKPTFDLSLKQARRIALTAQGFAESRRHAAPGRSHFGKVAGRLGVIQIDSVNVLTRTHYLPAFSRLGDYSQGVLETEAWGRKRTLFEYWGHEASLMPLEMQPLFRWRMARAESGETWGGLARFARERRDYIDNILDEIEKRGPVTGGDFAAGPRGQPGWWSWSEGKRALEWLFWTGYVTTATRRGFERVYDLTERALPAAITGLPTPSEEDAIRDLVLRSAKAMGVATEADLRDYYRLPLDGARRAVRELVEAGALTPVKPSRAGSKPAYLHAGGEAEAGQRPRPAVAVRQPDLVPRPGRAPVRHPDPAGDLHPGREAGARLLRPAVPRGRSDHRPGRPEGRPPGQGAAGAGRPRRARSRRGDARGPRRRA
jgi:uncharacterized protein YcaQ